MTFIKQRQENTKSRPEGGCINQNDNTLLIPRGNCFTRLHCFQVRKQTKKKKSGGDKDSRSKLNQTLRAKVKSALLKSTAFTN